MLAIPALTGLRFVAAISVAFAHGIMVFMQAQWQHVLPAQLAVVAGFGMSCFFILSGFVIHYNYGGALRTGGRTALANFYVARFARLYPLFALLFLLELCLGQFVRKHVYGWPVDRFGWQGLLSHLTMTQSWFFAMWDGNPPIYQYGDVAQVSWSISTEWFFYLAFPLICRWLWPVASARILLAGIAALLMAGPLMLLVLSRLEDPINAVALGLWGPDAWFAYRPLAQEVQVQNSLLRWVFYFSPFSRLLEFGLGCLLAQLWLRHPAPWPAHIRRLLGVATGLTVLATLALLLPSPRLSSSTFWMMLVSAFGFGPVSAALLVQALQPTGLVARLLGHRWMVAGGEASYGIYLLHLPLYHTLRSMPFEPTAEHFLRNGIAFAIALGVTVALALLLHHGFEAPARRAVREWLAPAGKPRIRLLRWGAGGMALAFLTSVGLAAAPLLSGEAYHPLPGITVMTATYGQSCFARNVTAPLAAACNGHSSCRYRVDVTVLGDPAPGCAKDFAVSWLCPGATRLRRAYVSPEAGLGSEVDLSCATQ